MERKFWGHISIEKWSWILACRFVSSKNFFLAVQNSSIGDLVPCSLGPLGTTNNQSLHNTTEWPQRLVTFETFDQRDEKTWLYRQFLIILTIFNNFDYFRQFWQFFFKFQQLLIIITIFVCICILFLFIFIFVFWLVPQWMERLVATWHCNAWLYLYQSLYLYLYLISNCICILTCATVHYGEVEKNCWKWSTLRAYLFCSMLC